MAHGTRQPGLLTWFTNLYPVWLLAFAAVGLFQPNYLLWFRGPWVVWALTTVMLGMGFTLTFADFRRIFQVPATLGIAVLAHYTIMPLAGWTIAHALKLEPTLATGLILLASCPSGTASNVISFVARANVALAVMVTLTSTLVAFVMTPLWCKTLAGAYVPVDAVGLSLSTLKIAVAPVLVGVLCNWRFPHAVAKVSRGGPVISIFALMFITGGIVAQSAQFIVEHALRLLIAATTLHLTGFGVGYLVAKLLKYPEDIARTISIESGMQNGGLAAVLARQNFPLDPLTALPSVFSGVIQTLLGSIVATYWRATASSDAAVSTSSESTPTKPAAHPRSTIYYWKTDRPAQLHGTSGHSNRDSVEPLLRAVLRKHFADHSLKLEPGNGEGNHLTWIATAGGSRFFVRVEDGPERDDHLEVESRILDEARSVGVPSPRVHGFDVTRRLVPFAWQALEMIPAPDLNLLTKEGHPDTCRRFSREIGKNVARWQAIRPKQFGPFDIATLRRNGELCGYHQRYEDYFMLHFERHLAFLTEREFMNVADAREIEREVTRHRTLLDLDQGCLVHKDLALWNILGTPEQILAYIDWDDAIAGDPMDDLSLLGCFHDGDVLSLVLEGYSEVKALPTEYRRRFWLHLLRNMIVKSVIRVGAGYFDRTENFFLLGKGQNGADLRTFTTNRIAASLRGLRQDAPIQSLSTEKHMTQSAKVLIK